MEAFFTATLVVALAEIGDKTQLLSLLLAARFKKPVPIILGILVGRRRHGRGATRERERRSDEPTRDNAFAQISHDWGMVRQTCGPAKALP